MKKTLLLIALVPVFLLSIAGCAGRSALSDEVQTNAEAKDLAGHTLSIYCGAGMTKPFSEITDAFKAETGCEMEVTA